MARQDMVRTAAAELIRAAEEALRAAWCFWNEATQEQIGDAMQTMNAAIRQFEEAAQAHKHAVAFGVQHRVWVPIALDVQAILHEWRGQQT